MSSTMDLQKAGLNISPMIVTQEKKPWYKYNIIVTYVYFSSVTASLQWIPNSSSLHLLGQCLIYSTVNSFHLANQNIDNTLNMLHSPALVTKTEDHATYTFREMLKQPDVSKFVTTMMRKTPDHKSRGYWDVVPRLDNQHTEGLQT